MTDTVYCYPPNFKVLKNRLNLRDPRELAFFEAEFAAQRIAEGAPTGNFDLAHLRAIHRHLFQDVYEWAGELRTVEISKDGHQFQFRRFIETGMADVHGRLVCLDFLGGLDAREFAPSRFDPRRRQLRSSVREGNGRTQLLYLEQQAECASHPPDLTQIERHAWKTASRDAHFGRYEAMAECIATALDKMRP